MKYFVFSDVHGCIQPLKASLAEKGYDQKNQDHKLIFLGDAFGHNDSGFYETYLFLKESMENDKLIWIYGNHEIYLLNCFDKGEVGQFTRTTIRDIASGLDSRAMKYSDLECLNILKKMNVDRFLRENCRDYFETNRYVFTHGFVPYLKKENKLDQNWRNVTTGKWNNYRTENGMKMINEGLRIPGKTLVCGHVGAYYGFIIKNHPEIEVDSPEFEKLKRKIWKNAKEQPAPFEIYYGDGVIGIDTRAYDTNRVNVLIVEVDE